MLVSYLQKVPFVSRCLTVFALGVSVFQIDAVEAQSVRDIVPDKTLGSQNSRVERVNATRDRITGGATRGANLFHSFEKFDVREGRAAYFANPDGIATIFSRVTGNNRSEIFGTLGVEGKANLFFINPSGIIFGPNATLDVRGAFVGSTASSIAFPNGENFSATNPNAPPLLTIDVPVPIGLRFEGSNNGIIVNQADIKAGDNFALIGAAIHSKGQISAPGGYITLATVPGAVNSVVRLEGTGEYIGQTSGMGQPNLTGRNIILTGGTIDASSNWTGGNVTFDSAGNVSLSNATFVDVRGANGGSIAVNAQNLEIAGGSQLLAGIGRGLGFRGASAGDVRLAVAKDAVLTDASRIENRVNENAIGNAGDINVRAGSLKVLEGSLLDAGTLGIGNAGNVTAKIQDTLSIAGSVDIFSANSSGIEAVAYPGDQGNGGNINLQAKSIFLSTVAQLLSGSAAVGDSGNITLQAKSISLTDGARIIAGNDGGGNAGSIKVQAEETLSIAGFSPFGGNTGIFSDLAGGRGNAGNIELEAGSIKISDLAQIGTNNLGVGNAGKIAIRARDSVTVSNNGLIYSNLIGRNAVGNAGRIYVEADSVDFSGGSQLQIFARGGAQVKEAGAIAVKANKSVSLTGSETAFIFGATASVVGDAGEMTLSASSLSLSDDAQLLALNDGQGNAGNIFLNISGAVSLVDSQILNNVQSGSEGNGGQISIRAGSLSLTDSARISTSIFGKGNAGNINIEVDGAITLAGSPLPNQNRNVFLSTGIFSIIEGGRGSPITPTGEGQGGNVSIRAGSLTITNGAQINVGTFGKGDAGNININVDEFVTISGFDFQRETGVSRRSFFVSTGIFGTVGETGEGRGGDISLHARSLSLNSGGRLESSTAGKGDAGNIDINVRDDMNISGFEIRQDWDGNNSIFPSSIGSAVSSGGRGNTGNISIQVGDLITLTELGNIRNSIGSGGIGQGKNISIQARSLTLSDGSQILSSLEPEANGLPGGKGIAGNISINASDFVSISGVSSNGFSSGLFTSTERGASGAAGEISVTTGAFRLADGAVLQAQTANEGDAGEISIDANTFEATGGGQIITATRDRGNANNIRLNVRDRIILSGSDPTFSDRLARFGRDIVSNQGAESGLFANTESSSTGDGGSIFINSQNITISDRARVSIDSQGLRASDRINIATGSLTLDNSSILAETARTTGGNITLDVQDSLSLRNGSQISTTSGSPQVGGDGGDIDINARTIFAVPQENSDISANAFEGTGGEININTESIFGIEFRDRLTPLSDITASSERGAAGQVIINTSGVEPTRGLESLTEERINVEVAQGCQVGTAQGGRVSFYNVGRGGLPPSPDDLFDSPMQGEWLSLESAEDSNTEPQTQNNSPDLILKSNTIPVWTFSCSATR